MDGIRSVQELLNAIDEMEIYENDYPIFLSLLKNADDAFFAKVMEEIINGEVDIVDFEKILPEVSYREIMEQNLPKQAKMKREIEKIAEKKGSDFVRKNNIGISKFFNGNDDASKIAFYENEEKIFRDKILYSMLSIRPDDDNRERPLKSKIADAITNFKYLEKHPELLNKVKNGKILFSLNGDQHSDAIIEFPVLDPKEVIISQTELIIPIEYNSQILDSADYEFMTANNIQEEEMKKIKSLAVFMRQNQYLGGLDNE